MWLKRDLDGINAGNATKDEKDANLQELEGASFFVLLTKNGRFAEASALGIVN